MSGRRKHKGGDHGEEHVDERWLVSYADMITVLMCLFLVLFAMSTVDAAKYAQLKDSLATGFGQESTDTVDAAVGVIVPPELVDAEGAGFTATLTAEQQDTQLEIARAEVAALDALKAQIEANLAAAGQAGKVSFVIDERGLTAQLVGSSTFFDGNSDALRAETQVVLGALAPAIVGIPNQISVEGHADPNGSAAPFATDWELSSGRATQVLRFFVEHASIPGTRISAVGFGSSRPVATGQPSEQNRRVDIVILSLQADGVRALIPGVVDGTAHTSAETAAAEKEAAAAADTTSHETTTETTTKETTKKETTTKESGH